MRRWTRTIGDLLPKGHTLPEDVWRVRHHTLTNVLRLHVLGILIFSLARGYSVPHSIADAAVVAAFAVLAAFEGHRRLCSAAAAVGLVTSSAVLVHVSGGSIEMHFHFFVMVGVLTLYQDWLPFLLAIGFVVAHHGILGTLMPDEVYNHPSAVDHPFRWALIHGGFVLAASIASVTAWRLNEEQALHDPLTRLPNRRLFQDRVAHALARTQRRPSSLAVLFLDLDGFKAVNDTLGHAAGDQLLTTVGDRLRAALRAADTAARFGGDEFAVLVEDINGEPDAVSFAERILTALSTTFIVRGKEVSIGASIGIALNDTSSTLDTVLRSADVAMYAAKVGGRGRFELYQSDMQTVAVARAELEQDLQFAVSNGELALRYQPVVSLTTGRMAGVEALLRWDHPSRGVLEPADFLEVAEATGAIIPIGAWVLAEACRQGQEWCSRFPQHPFTVSVNLSAVQLFRRDIVDTIANALEGSGFPANALILELTESVLIKNSAAVIERLHELKGIGVQLAIDDFGTGYSSLGYLQQLPVDIVKIAETFVDGVAKGGPEPALTEAIIKLSRTLDMETVAEGVKGSDQARRLREFGCDLAQGFRFARPLEGPAIDALFGAATFDEAWEASTPATAQ
ncbi:MAG TPA: EAL domain-containing protein [Acidimicrobiales bacterium]|nr:EAL domain-containing protein [Acidimicrobiales bacterium]